MFNFTKLAAAAAIAVATTAGAASAVTTTPQNDADGTDGFTFMAFDSSLGTLTGVNYFFAVRAAASEGDESAFTGPVVSDTATATVDFFGQTNTTSQSGSGQPFVEVTTVASVSGTLTSGLAAFIDTGTLSADFTVDEVFDSGLLTVSYEYTPAAIPLPAGGALLIGGLGALAIARRKKS